MREKQMVVIEEHLQPNWGQGVAHSGMNNSNGHSNPAHLLSLVADLALEPLTDSQQALLAQLYDGLMALVGSSNGTTLHVNQIVNEQKAFLEPLVMCVPS